VLRVAVLASGNGTNFQALQDACATGYVDAEIVCVLTNNPSAAVLDRAARAGIEGIVVPHKGLDRDACDELILAELDRQGAELVCQAGYMRIRGRTHCKALEGRVFNVHPSLLPAFPGAHPIEDAWERGVKTSGVTIHFATEELDSGPIVLQRAVDVALDDTSASFEEKIHLVEYALYPRAVRLFAEGRLRIEAPKVVIDGDVPEPEWTGSLPPGLRS
jgi:phosphoribosylglycinamide formyltransferase-1